MRLWVQAKQAPYIETKPFHHSQRVERRHNNGDIELYLCVQHNYELEKDLLSCGDGIEVLTPEPLRQRIAERLKQVAGRYANSRVV